MTHKLFRFGFLGALMLGAMLVLPGLVTSVSAATCTSASTGNFSDPIWAATGGCGATPVAGDNVIIADTHVVTLTADPGFSLGTLAVDGTGVFNLASFNLYVSSTLTVSGNGGILNAQTGSLTVDGATSISHANATVTSTSGNLEFAAVTNAGRLGSNDGTITIRGSLTNTGIVNAPPADILYVYGDFDNTGGTFNHNNGLLNLAGTTDALLTNVGSVYNLSITKTGNKHVRLASGSITVGAAFSTSGANHFNLGSSNLLVNGNSTIGSGTSVTSTSGFLVFGDAALDSTGNSGSVSSTSGLLFFRGALTNNASSFVSVGTGALTFASTLTNSGTIDVNAGIASTTAAFTNNIGAIFRFTSGHVTSTNTVANDGDIFGGTGVFEVQDDYTGSGSFNAGTTTFKVSGSGDRNLGLGEAYNFENNVTGGGVVTMTRDLGIDGTFSSTESNTLNSVTFILSIAGAASVGSGTTVTSTTGTINFESATTNSGNIGTLSGNLRFSNTLNSIGTIHLGSGNATTTGAFTNDGTFYLESGHATATAALTNGGTGVIRGGSGTLEINSANFMSLNLAAGAFVAGTSHVMLTGGSGSIGLPAFSYNNLTIGKSGGTVTAAGTVAIGGFLTTVGGATLALTTSDLTVTGATTIGASTVLSSTTGGLTFAAVTNNGTVTSTSGTIIATTFANNSLLGNNTGDILISSHLTNVGTINAPVAGALTGLRVSGNFDNTGGTFNHNGGTLTFTGASGAVITSVSSVYNLGITKTGGSSIAVVGSDLAVAGTLSTSGAGGNFLNLTTRNLVVSGASTIGASTAVTSTSGNLLFTSLGNSGSVSSTTGLIRVTGITTNGGSLATTAGAIRLQSNITNSGTISFGAGIATTTAAFLNDVGGTVYLQSAHVTTTATWTDSASIIGENGTLDFNDASFSGSGGFNAGDSTVVFSGSSWSSVAAENYNNLRITKTGGASVSFAGTVTMDGDFTVVGANNVNAVANHLVVGGNTSIGAGTSVTSTSGKLIFGSNPLVSTFTNAGSVSSTVGLLRFVSAVTNSASSNLSTNTGAMTFTGTVLNSGNIYVNAGYASTTGASSPFTNVSGGVLHIDGGYVTSTGPFYNNGGASLAAGGGTVTFMDNFHDPIGGFSYGTHVYYSGSVSATSTAASYNTVFVDKTGGATLTWVGTPTINGAFVTSGSNTTDATTYGMIVVGSTTVGTGTVLTSSSGLLSFASLLTVGTGAVSSTSGMIRATDVTTNGGSIATTAGSIRLQGAVTNTGTISFGAGVATTTAALANTGTIYIQGSAVTTTGAWTNSSGGTIHGGTGRITFSSVGFTNASGATFTPGTGRVYLAGTGDVTFSGASYNDFTVAKTAGTVTMASSTAIGGTLVTSGGATVNAATNSFSVTGASTIGSGTTVTSTSGTLTFSGAVSNSGSIGTISGNQLYSSTLTNVGGSSVLHIGSGTATTTGTLTNPGTIYGGTGLLSVLGSWSNAGTFTRGTGTVRFVGTSGQTVPAVTFYDLLVRTTGGDADLSGYTSVSGTITVVTSTTLDVDTYTLNAPGTYLNSGTVTLGTGGAIIHPNSGYDYTDSSGTTASSVAAGSGVVYITLADANRNLLGGTIETINVVGTVGGDSVTLTLTETGASTGIFRNASGATLSSSCAPDPGNGTFEVIAASGSLSSTYTDSVDSSDSTVGSVPFTATAPSCSSGGGGGGGGGGTSAGSGGGSSVSSVPLPTSYTTPTPPAPAPAPAPVPTPAPAPAIRFVGPPTAIVTGQQLRFSYTYRNTSRASQSLRLVRELVDARGRVVRSSRGTATVRAGATYTNNVRETVLTTTPAGAYRVRIRFLDARGRVLEENSFPLTVTRPAPVRRPAVRR